MQPHGYGQAAPDRLGATFAALADPTRRAILARLRAGQAFVMEFDRALDRRPRQRAVRTTAPRVQRLAGTHHGFHQDQPEPTRRERLERAGLISRGHDAQRRPRRLEARPLAEATKWLEGYRRFWEGNYQRLDALLEELKAGPKKRPRRKRQGDKR